jgi:hypothetical protein
VAPKYGNKVATIEDNSKCSVNACIFINLFTDWIAERSGNPRARLSYLVIDKLIQGAAIVAQAQGKPQFNQWFLYVLLVFVVCTLLVEIVFLNVTSSLKSI